MTARESPPGRGPGDSQRQARHSVQAFPQPLDVLSRRARSAPLRHRGERRDAHHRGPRYLGAQVPLITRHLRVDLSRGQPHHRRAHRVTLQAHSLPSQAQVTVNR